MTQEKLFYMPELTENRFAVPVFLIFEILQKNKMIALHFALLLRKVCDVLSGHFLKCFAS